MSKSRRALSKFSQEGREIEEGESGKEGGGKREREKGGGKRG